MRLERSVQEKGWKDWLQKIVEHIKQRSKKKIKAFFFFFFFFLTLPTLYSSHSFIDSKAPRVLHRDFRVRWWVFNAHVMCGGLASSPNFPSPRKKNRSFSTSSSSVLLLTFVLNMFLSFIRNRRFLQPTAASQVRPSICPPVVASSLLLIRTFRRNPSTSPLTVPHLSTLSASSLVESW